MPGTLYIFAGGGTGGHLLPALAVAERLATVQPAARVVFACSSRPIDRRILSPASHAVVPQPIRPLPRGLRGWGGFLASVAASWRLARRLLRDLRPRAVLGLGGFAAVPVTCLAARAHLPTALLSIDAVPGLANRRLAGVVDVIFTQFQRTAGAYGRHARKVRLVGLPVPSALARGSAEEARAFFGLRKDRRTLLVMAGSQGAENINRAVAALRADLEALSADWQVLHLTGPGKLAEVQAEWCGSTVHHVAMEFCERMELAYAAADVALCRAGACTVGELAVTGVPAVFMPYPYHRDRQQWLNAEELVSAGAALAVEDKTDPAANASSLRSALLPLLSDRRRLEAMRQASAGRERAGAAEAIARWLARG